MKDFRHFLLTRFNLPIIRIEGTKPAPQRVVDASHKLALDPEWLDFRMRFFRRFCLPSVLAQTTKDFTWRILVSDKTPKPICDELGQHADVVRTTYHDYFAGKVIATTPFIIATNLDSDDALSTNYLEEIQKAFRKQREFLNVTFGYALSAYEQDKEYFYIGKRSLKNPFRSFVYPNGEGHNLYSVTHGLADTLAPVRQLEPSPAVWLQVIHGKNLANRYKRMKDDKPQRFIQISSLFK